MKYSCKEFNHHLKEDLKELFWNISLEWVILKFTEISIKNIKFKWIHLCLKYIFVIFEIEN